MFPYASSKFYEQDSLSKVTRLETQLGELLKILGKTKSAYNHLFTAYTYLGQVC